MTDRRTTDPVTIRKGEELGRAGRAPCRGRPRSLRRRGPRRRHRVPAVPTSPSRRSVSSAVTWPAPAAQQEMRTGCTATTPRPSPSTSARSSSTARSTSSSPTSSPGGRGGEGRDRGRHERPVPGTLGRRPALAPERRTVDAARRRPPRGRPHEGPEPAADRDPPASPRHRRAARQGSAARSRPGHEGLARRGAASARPGRCRSGSYRTRSASSSEAAPQPGG